VEFSPPVADHDRLEVFGDPGDGLHGVGAGRTKDPDRRAEPGGG
jgi:hypothetical protein